MINSFDCDAYRALSKTEISECLDAYIYKQKFHKMKKIINPQRDDFLDLVDALNYFESIGFVHGDLNRKNIICTTDGFKIIDFEPSLCQEKDGRGQFMVTKPYISRLDLENGIITIRTDKLAFYYFVLRVSGKMTSKDVVSLCRDLDHHRQTGMSEESLARMSYMDILDYANQ